MRKKPGCTKGLSLLLLVALMLWALGCSREERFIGVYESEPNNESRYSDVYLELKKGGEGIRKVQGKSFTFEWSLKGDEMRITTRSGGTIVGRLEGKDALVVILPGPRIVHFKKIK